MSAQDVAEESSSSDESVQEDLQDGVQVAPASSSFSCQQRHERPKRSTKWCGNKALRHSDSLSWPPPSSFEEWRSQLRNVPKPGNPMFGSKMQLFSKTNYNLAVYADGCVRGTMDDDDLHTHLELSSAGSAGYVRIQGILTKLYVAMDRKGTLYGEPDVTEESTVFVEAFQGSYNSYLSRKYAHLGWYIGIKKSGRAKKGPKTSYRQKAVNFLPRRSKFQ